MVRNRGALSAGATQQLRPFAGISWGRVFNSRCSAVLYCIRFCGEYAPDVFNTHSELRERSGA